MSIWWLVVLAILIVLVSILVFRLHAFLTLLLAGLLVAVLTSGAALRQYAETEAAKMVAADKLSVASGELYVQQFTAKSAPARLAGAFGETAGKIGIVIALASIIGSLLLESGAAATIVDTMLRVCGEKRAPEALAASSFVLGIPVFFDTVFYLMIPLARSLRRRLGKNYVLYILAILAGGSIAHSLVPPTPGPLTVANELGIEISTMMIAGLVIGGCTSVLSLLAARVINHFVDVPLRDIEGDEAAGVDSNDDSDAPATPDTMTLPENRPSLLLALMPIVIPVLLLAAGSVVTYLTKSGSMTSSGLSDTIKLLGDKNIALGLGCVAAFGLVSFVTPGKRKSLTTRALASGGNIILITAAGGAFGVMLRQGGIADAVSSLATGVPGLMLLPLAFGVTVAIRTLQGSATVAMITAAGVLQGFAASPDLPFHPVYLAMAIGAGSKPVSWMTDSAFWVITRMSGMTEAEGLRVISPMSTAMGFSALAVTMVFAIVYPAV